MTKLGSRAHRLTSKNQDTNDKRFLVFCMFVFVFILYMVIGKGAGTKKICKEKTERQVILNVLHHLYLLNAQRKII